MPKHQSPQIFELENGKVSIACSFGRLVSLDSNPHMRFLYHVNIVETITYRHDRFLAFVELLYQFDCICFFLW